MTHSASSTNPVPDSPDRKPMRLGMRTKMLLRLLDKIQIGELELTLPDGSVRHFRGGQSQGQPSGPRAQLIVHDLAAISIAVSRGDIGFGEGYMQGLWSTPDLTGLLRFFISNRQVMERVIYGQWWSLVIDQIRHLLRANRKQQARKNIAAHYDLGNDFYRLWLDPTMTYSSALWEGSGSWGKPVDLQQGQHQKIDRAIASLELSSIAAGQRVLEIGCGWAGFAYRLLETHPIEYVGLTLSTEQKRWGDERLSAYTPSRFEIRLQDYRDEQQQYDGIVSIEMFEAVGEQYWNDYFQTLHRCLKPGARAVIQTITIDEPLFERYRQSTDFIQQYIFPGGMLPSKTAFRERAIAAGLEVQEAFCFGQDYSRTLAEWAKTFDARSQEIEALGFKESFQRMWRFYLSYCEAGFAEGNLDVVQFTLSRPES